MAKDDPPVFVVDTHATRPPLPPRLGERKQQIGPAQTLLFMLVSVALCGIAIEACLIYSLYQRGSDASASSSKLSGGADVVPTAAPGQDIPPSKPVAHLTDGQDVHHKQHIMAWSTNPEPLLFEIGYEDGALIIQKTGYYFVYSKVFFTNNDKFHHSIMRKTAKYIGGGITLLQSRTYSKMSHNPIVRSNSYLGGVFYLEKDDSIYVNVSSSTKIERHGSYENVFGTYMI